MKTIQNSIPKPLNWIWRIILKAKECASLLNLLAKMTGVKLKHGKYIIEVKNFKIVKISILQSTVVDVEDDEETEPQLIEKNGKKPLENEN